MSPTLSAEGRRLIEDIAQRHAVGVDTAENLLRALVAGGGGMAQFNIAELGGLGQWSRGGMTMVGDMFNNQLKARVDGLCADLAALLERHSPWAPPTPSQARMRMQSQSQGQGGAPGLMVSLFIPGGADVPGGGWPADLGQPATTGSQNNLRYAYFPATRRLAVDIGGRITIYDSGDHQISGVSQQQAGDQSLTFTSQHGVVRLDDLPVVDGARPPAPVAVHSPPPAPATSAAAMPPPADPSPAPAPPAPAPAVPGDASPPSGAQGTDLISKIERLAALRDRGILSEEEFAAKKTELLSRL